MKTTAVPVKAVRNPPEGGVLAAFPEIGKLVHDIEQGRRPMSLETLDLLAATAAAHGTA